MAENTGEVTVENAEELAERVQAVLKATTAIQNFASGRPTSPKQLRRMFAIYKFATADLQETFKEEIPVNKRGPRTSK